MPRAAAASPKKKDLSAKRQALIVSAQQAVQREHPLSAGYQAIPHIMLRQPRDLPPFSFATIHAMLIDPEIRLNLSKRSAPICKAEFGYKEGEVWTEGVRCSHPEIGQFIYRQLQKIWNYYLPALLRSQVWGWAAGEVTLKLSSSGLTEIDKLLPRHATDCRLLLADKSPWGVRITRIRDSEANAGHVDLQFPYCFFHNFNAEDGDHYGVSALLGCYSPWASKWFMGGALDVRQLFMHKDAYGGVDLGYPDGETLVNGQFVPNVQIARQIVEQLVAGGVTTRPSKRDENGNEQWPLTRATVTSNPAHILQYPKDLDAEIRAGLEVPEEEGDAWASKRVTMASFYASLDQWIVQIVCDLKEQLLDNLCLLNFGLIPDYEIKHKPLAEQAMEQQSNAGPGAQQGDPNAGGLPGLDGQPQGLQQPGMAPSMPQMPADQSQQQPQLMDLLSRARQAVRMSAQPDTPEESQTDDKGGEYAFDDDRIEAMADLLAAIYGDHAEENLDQILSAKRMALWSPADHPRGKNGRFIPKGTAEAYALAKDRVDEAHRSRSPESMKALMDHMNTLTVAQLHKLKAEYGTKASAATKQALIEKLSNRLTEGRHRTGRREDDTPRAPVREDVYTVPVKSLRVDPARFQYKVKGIDKGTGIGEELKGTSKWNPELGGVLLAWRDPDSGKDYVVNGHHRYELANRTGTDSVNVRYIDAPTAKTARAVGALANIAEGRGTALDAAKYLRDSGRDIEHFRDAGISLTGKVASDASQLVDLSEKAFQEVTQGRIDEDKAVAVAKHLKKHDLQDKLFKKIAQREDDGKDWSTREIEAAAKKMARAGSVTQSGTDLFGDWESEESTFDQEVELESYIAKALAQEANDFAAVSSSRRAERVAETGNVLNVDKNLHKRDSARTALADFEREAGLRGQVADTIKAKAAELAKASKKADRESIKRATLEAVRQLIDEPETVTKDKNHQWSDAGSEALAMSVSRDYGGKKSEWQLSDDDASTSESVARHIICGQTTRMSVDKTGHEHKGKGPGGGQFTSKGGGGGGASNTSQSQSKPAAQVPAKPSAPPTSQPVATAPQPASAAPQPTSATQPPQPPNQPPNQPPPTGDAKKPVPVSPGAINPAGLDTMEQFTKDGQWSPERQKLHQQIIAKHFEGKTPVQNPVSYVLGGGPASGKSSIVHGGHVAIDANTVHIDSDAIKGMLPEYQQMVQANDHRAASHVHEESSYIANLIQEQGSQGKYNTLLDGTGDSGLDKLQRKVQKMREAGQKVIGHYVTVPTEVAIQRNIERAKKTGRLPPEDMLRNCHASVSQIVPKAVDGKFFDEFALWDTTNGVVKVASQQNGGQLQIHDPKLWQDFIAKGQT
jgi:predicted ABC-type ATPase